MFDRNLPNIEKTLVDLVLGLLRAKTEHSDLVCGPVDDRGEATTDSVRVTQHYVAGLLAYGFDMKRVQLQEAKDWFSVEFPSDEHHQIDRIEMTRLEALLLLEAPAQEITPRLEQLAQQHPIGSDYFYIDPERRSGEFDTLWALKVLLLAEERGMLNGLIAFDEIKALAERPIPINGAIRNKDRALMLRLRYQLTGALDQNGLDNLQKLITIAEETGGVWGDLNRNMLWLVEAMSNNKLAASDDRTHQQALWDMVLSTCYVIENLAPLVGAYPVLVAPIQTAMELWWGVFHGDQATKELQALFPRPYDYLTILARTLVALRAFIHDPLINRVGNHTYDLLAKHEVQQTVPHQHQNLKRVIREWYKVRLSGEVERMRLGMSGTNIVRVEPRICNPMLSGEDSGTAIPGATTLIIKSGPIAEIEQEYKNYRKLSPHVRRCFALVPEPIAINEEGQAFLILQDLHDYRTLDDRLSMPSYYEAIKDELGPFLLGMHTGQIDSVPFITEGLLQELYLLPMQTHIKQIFSYIHNVQSVMLLDQIKLDEADKFKKKLHELIGDLLPQQYFLEKFPTALMHGDLHSRNIMIHKPEDLGASTQSLVFKLIDLEKLRVNGDVAFDAGELLADLQLLSHRKNQAAIKDLMKVIHKTYLDFAANKNPIFTTKEDSTFATRLELAQARSLLRIAKGRTKSGQQALDENRQPEARRIVTEILQYMKLAIVHLQNVLNELQKL